MAAAQRARNHWVDRHQEEISRWSQMEGALRRYEYRLGRAATYTSPSHVTDLLGPLARPPGRYRTLAGGGRCHRGLSIPLERHGYGRSAPSRPTPSSVTIGVRPWPLWERQDFSAAKDPAMVESERGSLAAHWEVDALC